jgi:Zn-dependent M28 family amino/carboxypeptidase
MVRFGNLRVKVIFLLAVIFVFACGDDKKPTSNQKVEAPKKAVRPNFNADTAYHFIQKQVDFGPRVPNTEAHVAAGNYLAAQLGRFGFDVIEQKAQVVAFDNTKLNIKNIIGAYKPELNNRVLLFAHWDSRPNADQDEDEERKMEPILGANDGASGVGVLLEIARQIQSYQPNIGVDIIFFDAEDYADDSGTTEDYCLGSQYWANNMHKIGYSANFGILLDMVGGKDAMFAKEHHSMTHASAYVHHVWNVANDLGYDNYFNNRPTRHVGIDDHVYVNTIAKIPSIDIIQYDPETRSFAPHWHTHDDDMDIIDKETLRAVGETVLATVLMEAN